MAERPQTPGIDIQVGDVSGSQLVIGDHNTIQTAEGTKVTVLQVGDRPTPRLRQMPIDRRPAGTDVIGRDDERALAASAMASEPVQLYARDGAGKTSLLKSVALQATAPEGVLFEATRRRTLDEIQAKLYTAFWESDVPFLPAPAEVGGFLADRKALLVLDDCGLDRDDLDTLLDSVPRCPVVLASEERSLWSRGKALALGDLDPAAAMGLFERELGRAIGPEERSAAEAIVARIGGHPQSLVEAAALASDGESSLPELAADPAAFARSTDPSVLSDAQRRTLDLLSALEGAPLGVEHVASLTGQPDALQQLQDLERRGWVKAASPRYRLVRPLRSPSATHDSADQARRVLDHLSRWSGQAAPSDVADEADAIEGALDLGAASGRWDQALALAQAAEGKLTVAGSLTASRRVLGSGLRAAVELGDDAARARFLHQLGSLSLCLGDDRTAVAQLTEALQIRERLGEQDGADLTRHNLGQLGGNGGANGRGGGGGGPWRPRAWIVLTALALIAGGIAAAVLAAGDSEKTADRSTTRPPAGAPPRIAIERPAPGATFKAKQVVTASYGCTAAEGSRITSCKGTVEVGERIDTSPGDHEFVVKATDSDGRSKEKVVRYSVSSEKPSDVNPPTIGIASPEGRAYKQGEVLVTGYGCKDSQSGLKSCVGELTSCPPEATGCGSEVKNEEALSTRVPGEYTFTVTALDNAENEKRESVEYRVIPLEQKGPE